MIKKHNKSLNWSRAQLHASRPFRLIYFTAAIEGNKYLALTG